MKNNIIKDRPSFLSVTKNILVNDINFIDRRSIRNENENYKKMKSNNIKEEENNFIISKALENPNIIEKVNTDYDVDFKKKIKQHKVQKMIDIKLKENPNDRKIFEHVLKKNTMFNRMSLLNTHSNLNFNILKPTSLKRIMSLSPYSTIPNRVKFSWVNNPNLAKFYEPKLTGSLMDQEGNRFKHVSHGSSTIFFKDSVEKNDLLRNLLDFHIDIPYQFKKLVKIKNIKRIVKIKTSNNINKSRNN